MGPPNALTMSLIELHLHMHGSAEYATSLSAGRCSYGSTGLAAWQSGVQPNRCPGLPCTSSYSPCQEVKAGAWLTGLRESVGSLNRSKTLSAQLHLQEWSQLQIRRQFPALCQLTILSYDQSRGFFSHFCILMFLLITVIPLMTVNSCCRASACSSSISCCNFVTCALDAQVTSLTAANVYHAFL